jgi:hypothetical protein
MSNQLTHGCIVYCFEQTHLALFQYGCHPTLLNRLPGGRFAKRISLVNLVDFAFNLTRSCQAS